MNQKLLMLENRITRLERQNRYLKAAIGGIVVLGLMGAASQQDTLTASAFVLTDQNGVHRAELTLRDGSAGLFIMDEEGRDRLVAVHNAEETGLFLKDEQGQSRVGVAQFAHGGGGVALHGPEAKGAAVLYFKEQGSLRFFDASGKVTNQVRAIEFKE